MTRLSLRLLAPLAIAIFAVFSSAVPAAQGVTVIASPARVSFVGTYKVHGTLGTTPFKGTMDVRADGTAVDQFGNVAHWTASGKTITITFKSQGDTEVFVGTHSKKGISSKLHPGTITFNGSPAGTWYAIKTS